MAGGRRTWSAGLGVLAGACAASALAVGSAASVGGIGSGGLAAGTEVVAACDQDGMTSRFVTRARASGYVVTAVELNGVASACTGTQLALTLTDTGGTSLTEATTVVSGTSVTVAVPPVPVEQLGRELAPAHLAGGGAVAAQHRGAIDAALVEERRRVGREHAVLQAGHRQRADPDLLAVQRRGQVAAHHRHVMGEQVLALAGRVAAAAQRHADAR